GPAAPPRAVQTTADNGFFGDRDHRAERLLWPVLGRRGGAGAAGRRGGGRGGVGAARRAGAAGRGVGLGLEPGGVARRGLRAGSVRRPRLARRRDHADDPGHQRQAAADPRASGRGRPRRRPRRARPPRHPQRRAGSAGGADRRRRRAVRAGDVAGPAALPDPRAAYRRPGHAARRRRVRLLRLPPHDRWTRTGDVRAGLPPGRGPARARIAAAPAVRRPPGRRPPVPRPVPDRRRPRPPAGGPADDRPLAGDGAGRPAPGPGRGAVHRAPPWGVPQPRHLRPLLGRAGPGDRRAGGRPRRLGRGLGGPGTVGRGGGRQRHRGRVGPAAAGPTRPRPRPNAADPGRTGQDHALLHRRLPPRTALGGHRLPPRLDPAPDHRPDAGGPGRDPSRAARRRAPARPDPARRVPTAAPPRVGGAPGAGGRTGRTTDKRWGARGGWRRRGQARRAGL
ncbi:MAG: hypothetical protein AVDCRST_MAG73-4038, partial [uncultured Thermomicrobiales bacterium]